MVILVEALSGTEGQEEKSGFYPHPKPVIQCLTATLTNQVLRPGLGCAESIVRTTNETYSLPSFVFPQTKTIRASQKVADRRPSNHQREKELQLMAG